MAMVYRDRVEVRAGPLTPFEWLFAHHLYWHRQRRWKELVNADSTAARPRPTRNREILAICVFLLL